MNNLREHQEMNQQNLEPFEVYIRAKKHFPYSTNRKIAAILETSEQMVSQALRQGKLKTMLKRINDLLNDLEIQKQEAA